jgi:membrane-associated phospholipid phosphatase
MNSNCLMVMKLLFCYCLLLIPALAYSQKVDTLLHKLDSLNKKADTVGQKNIIKPQAYNESTKFTLKNYFIILGSDFKQQISAPLTMNKSDWSKAIKFGLVAGGMMLEDEPVQHHVVNWRKSSPVLSKASFYITNTGGTYEGVTLAFLATYGYFLKYEKIRTTALLASQAYITSEVFNQVLKNIAGRQRPSVYNKDQIDSEPTFRGPFANTGRDENGKRLNASFPSGHATLAFAAATVYAMEYKNRPLVPILSYTGASLISLSRLTENQHWVTDVLVGAALGYLSGRQVVNNYHRYAKIQDEQRQKSNLSLNFQYFQGSFLPGIVYRPGNRLTSRPHVIPYQ